MPLRLALLAGEFSAPPATAESPITAKETGRSDLRFGYPDPKCGEPGDDVNVRFESPCVRPRREPSPQVDQINSSLHNLELSKQKLTSSRELSEERARLSEAMLGLSGTAEGIAVATPDGGLQDDLKTAREAVVMAEALLEVKGN